MSVTKIGRPRTRSSKPVKIPEGSKLKHGMVGTYTNLGCGCWRCRKANTETNRMYRERRRQAQAAARIHDCPACRCGAA